MLIYVLIIVAIDTAWRAALIAFATIVIGRFAFANDLPLRRLNKSMLVCIGAWTLYFLYSYIRHTTRRSVSVSTEAIIYGLFIGYLIALFPFAIAWGVRRLLLRTSQTADA
ncbi:hypothetical protein ACT9ST_11075 [Sphingobium limneticum]|jgi:hypothetical protein|uniref:hypothetical protein n=1 Tax=Sphingobium TaxID=165695 RepID=UPI000E76C61B|nr:hypothetical protein [Sphingobium limneticum]